MAYPIGDPERDARRLSRRSLLRGAAGLTALTAVSGLLAACGQQTRRHREAGRAGQARRSREAGRAASRPPGRRREADHGPRRRCAGRQDRRDRRAALRLVGLAGPPRPHDQGDPVVPAEEPGHQDELRVRRVPGPPDQDDDPGDGRQPAGPDAAGLRLDLRSGSATSCSRRWTSTSPTRRSTSPRRARRPSTAARSTASCTPSTSAATRSAWCWTSRRSRRPASPLPPPNWTWADFEKTAMALHSEARHLRGLARACRISSSGSRSTWGSGSGGSATTARRWGTTTTSRSSSTSTCCSGSRRPRRSRTSRTRSPSGGPPRSRPARSSSPRRRSTTCGATSSWRSGRRPAKDRKLKLQPLPRPQGGTSENYFKPSQFISITTQSKRPKEAAKFVNFITNDVEANKILLGERGVPIAPAVLEAIKPLSTPAQVEVLDYMSRLEKDVAPLPPPDPAAAAEADRQHLPAAAGRPGPARPGEAGGGRGAVPEGRLRPAQVVVQKPPPPAPLPAVRGRGGAEAASPAHGHGRAVGEGASSML